MFEGPEGSKVFVDPKSYQFIKGTTLDYDTSLVSKGSSSTTRTPRAPAGAGRVSSAVALSCQLEA